MMKIVRNQILTAGLSIGLLLFSSNSFAELKIQSSFSGTMHERTLVRPEPIAPETIAYPPPGSMRQMAIRMCGDGDVDSYSNNAGADVDFIPNDQPTVQSILGVWIVPSTADYNSSVPTTQNWIPLGYQTLEIDGADSRALKGINKIPNDQNGFDFLEMGVKSTMNQSKLAYRMSGSGESLKLYAGLMTCKQYVSPASADPAATKNYPNHLDIAQSALVGIPQNANAGISSNPLVSVGDLNKLSTIKLKYTSGSDVTKGSSEFDPGPISMSFQQSSGFDISTDALFDLAKQVVQYDNPGVNSAAAAQTTLDAANAYLAEQQAIADAECSGGVKGKAPPTPTPCTPSNEAELLAAQQGVTDAQAALTAAQAVDDLGNYKTAVAAQPFYTQLKNYRDVVANKGGCAALGVEPSQQWWEPYKFNAVCRGLSEWTNGGVSFAQSFDAWTSPGSLLDDAAYNSRRKDVVRFLVKAAAMKGAYTVIATNQSSGLDGNTEFQKSQARCFGGGRTGYISYIVGSLPFNLSLSGSEIALGNPAAMIHPEGGYAINDYRYYHNNNAEAVFGMIYYGQGNYTTTGVPFQVASSNPPNVGDTFRGTAIDVTFRTRSVGCNIAGRVYCSAKPLFPKRDSGS